MDPISGILSLLGSNIGGSIIGWIGGWLNKREDYKVQKLLIEDKANDRVHQQKMKEIDIQIMEKELAGKERIAVIQNEGMEIKGAYEALAESYKHDSELGQKSGPLAQNIRSLTRPFITGWFTLVASVQAAFILYIGFITYKYQMTDSQMYELIKYSLMWVFFQAGLCIGWWFAARTSAPAPKPPKI